MKISRRAVGDRTLIPTQDTYYAPGGLSQDRHIEGLPLGTRGGMLVRHTFPMDAEYEISVTLQRDRNDLIVGMEEDRKLE